MNVKSTVENSNLGTMVRHPMSQRDLNSKLIPNTTFPIVENYVQKKNKKKSKKSKKIKKNQNKSKKIKKSLTRI